MSNERKVTVISPAIKHMQRVAIYCRVSTRSQDQLDSMANQISYLTQLASTHINWRLVDIYVDVKTGSNTFGRNEFQRMINDCENNKIDIIVTKSISRFGRNTAATVSTLNTLKGYNVDVYFENEEIHSKDSQNTFIITLIEGLSQEESYNRSENIRWGILRKIESGDAQILYRKCYGYCQDTEGNLQIQNEEAQVVQLIYNIFLNGSSILRIIKELETRSIMSPSGKTKWCKRTIDLILSNEKYTGNVVVNKTYNSGFPETKRYTNKGERDMFLAMDCNPAIISEEQFEKVKEEKTNRSNITVTEKGTARKPTHYSSKQQATLGMDEI